MKKTLFILLMLGFSMIYAPCSSASPPGHTIDLITPTLQVEESSPINSDAIASEDGQIGNEQNMQAAETPLWMVIGGALLGILEVVLRLVPTQKSYSLFAMAYNVLNTVLPDNSHEVHASGVRKKFKIIPTDRS